MNVSLNLNGCNTSFDETPADRPSRNGLATLPGILETHYPIDLIIFMLAPTLLSEPISPYMSDSFDATSVKKSNQLAKHYAELAQKENCAFLNIGDLVTVSPIDSVHIDEHGQPIVAKAIAEKILAMKI